MGEYLAKPTVFCIVLVGTNAAVGYNDEHTARGDFVDSRTRKPALQIGSDPESLVKQFLR